ncbi:MAG: hypothetical protein IT210_17035 [Armatimonadetes bacterium]|nr:hypothetical protein [Armatimonadota bacterium]
MLMILTLIAVSACAAYTLTPEGFDRLESQLGLNRTFEKASSDVFAWSESYILRGYIEMYLATGRTEYLDRLVRIGDAVLQTRDDRRQPGAAPIWSLSGHYTVAKLILKDEQGRDAVLLRSIRYAYNNQTIVKAVPGTPPGTFRLKTENAFWQQYGPAEAVYDSLSLDTKSPRYFERVINDPMYIADERFQRSVGPEEPASFLLVALDIRKHKRASDRLAPVGPAALVPGTVRYYGYIGPIFAPLTRFASLVLERPALQAGYGEAARRYIQAARESIAAYESCWRKGPGREEGHYLLIEKGADFWCDGIMAPFNYMCSTAQVLANLWDWTKDRRILDKVRRIARLLKNNTILTPREGYAFPYWSPTGYKGWSKKERLSLNTPSYSPTQVADDLSHGAAAVEFAAMCFERGIVFDRADMERFARTFTRNLWRGDPKGLNPRVDGSGGPASDSVAAARWLDLARFDPRIFEITRSIWEANGYDKAAYGHAIGGYARLYRWQEELRAKRGDSW